METIAPAHWIEKIERSMVEIAAGQRIPLSEVLAELDAEIDAYEAKKREREAIAPAPGPGSSLG